MKLGAITREEAESVIRAGHMGRAARRHMQRLIAEAEEADALKARNAELRQHNQFNRERVLEQLAYRLDTLSSDLRITPGGVFVGMAIGIAVSMAAARIAVCFQ